MASPSAKCLIAPQARAISAAMDADVEWRVEPGLTPYPHALAIMEARAAQVHDGSARELVWLVEHPPLYTAGTSAAAAELLSPGRFPVYAAGRGGRYTYHGPGQRTGYLILDLAKRGRDVRLFVHSLEAWLAATLARFGVSAHTVCDRVGLWTHLPDGREAKIGAIGVRVRRWVTLHGFAINVAPDLSHFSGIVPCGLGQFPVTSLKALGTETSLEGFDAALKPEFGRFLAELSAARQSLE